MKRAEQTVRLLRILFAQVPTQLPNYPNYPNYPKLPNYDSCLPSAKSL